VRKDGEEIHRYDSTQLFEKVKFKDPFGRKEDVFDQWKEDMTEKRKTIGLRVIQPRWGGACVWELSARAFIIGELERSGYSRMSKI